jgi:hypothetical protein
LCSVASEDLNVGVSSIEVVPFLLVLSLPQEQAEMGQLLLLETHIQILGNRNKHLTFISVDSPHN